MTKEQKRRAQVAVSALVSGICISSAVVGAGVFMWVLAGLNLLVVLIGVYAPEDWG